MPSRRRCARVRYSDGPRAERWTSAQDVLGGARIEAAASAAPASAATPVAPEPGLGDAARVGAAIVLRDHLDVLVPVASLELVFDSEIGEVDLFIEVREVVFTRPCLDLVRVAIGPAV